LGNYCRSAWSLKQGRQVHPVGHAETHHVTAVPADEPPVLVGNHRPIVDARHAIWAADDQDCVGQQRALPHMSKGDGHAGFQTPSPVIPLKTKESLGATRVLNRNPHRHFGRRADRRADQQVKKTVSRAPHRVKKRKRPDSKSHGTLVRTALPRKLLSTSLRSDLHCGNGSDVLRGTPLGAHPPHPSDAAEWF
jgi:hypothetical protein